MATSSCCRAYVLCTPNSRLRVIAELMVGRCVGVTCTQACAKMFDEKVQIYAEEERAPEVRQQTGVLKQPSPTLCSVVRRVRVRLRTTWLVNESRAAVLRTGNASDGNIRNAGHCRTTTPGSLHGE